jgi:GNAT superfamily N-acetyltransferase
MAFAIRFATPSDAVTILGFIRALAEYERDPGAVEATVEQLRGQMESDDPPFECLVAEYDAEAVGFALFFRNYSTWSGRAGLYLEDIFVREAYRGRGVGGALIRRLAQIAEQRGWRGMDWAVLNWNTPAQSFYREFGARPLGSWTPWRLDGDAFRRAARKSMAES